MIDLTQARAFQSPKNVLEFLSSEADRLKIEKFDVYGDFTSNVNSSWMRYFENQVADYLGHEDALFLPSGVMAQMITLCVNRERSTCKDKDSFLCHYSSHLLIHEQDSFSELLKMNAVFASPSAYEEVQTPLRHSDVDVNLASFTPSTVIVECPHREIGGKCTSFEDLKVISSTCREKGIGLHMDGARLWEASAYYCSTSSSDDISLSSSNAITIKDLCALFDSIYVSFYKGLGGITGAMLLGDKVFISQSRVWLRRFGGNLFTLTPYALSAYVGFEQNVNSFQIRRDRLKQVIAIATRYEYLRYEMSFSFLLQSMYTTKILLKFYFWKYYLICKCNKAKKYMEFVCILCRVAGEEAAVAAVTESSSRPLVRFDPPVPVVSLIHVYLAVTDVKLVVMAREAAASVCGIVAVSPNLKAGRFGATGQVYFEMNMGPANMGISDADWESGWRTFLTTLRRVLSEAEK